MTNVVTENCIKCKYMDYVEVCPVDCFYAGENMLVIHPDECIDSGVCEPECPADAIKPDTEPAFEDWAKLNREYSAKWPNTHDGGHISGRCERAGSRAWQTQSIRSGAARGSSPRKDDAMRE